VLVVKIGFLAPYRRLCRPLFPLDREISSPDLRPLLL
jgi:hypothetical protein